MNPPKRKFWQFHLATAIGLMLLMAIILWLNLRLSKLPVLFESWGDGNNSHDIFIAVDARGWPFYFHREWINEWNIANAIIDGVIAITAATSLFVVSEWLIRRREAKRHE